MIASVKKRPYSNIEERGIVTRLPYIPLDSMREVSNRNDIYIWYFYQYENRGVLCGHKPKWKQNPYSYTVYRICICVKCTLIALWFHYYLYLRAEHFFYLWFKTISISLLEIFAHHPMFQTKNPFAVQYWNYSSNSSKKRLF